MGVSQNSQWPLEVRRWPKRVRYSLVLVAPVVVWGAIAAWCLP
jgi:hypothetical protein